MKHKGLLISLCGMVVCIIVLICVMAGCKNNSLKNEALLEETEETSEITTETTTQETTTEEETTVPVPEGNLNPLTGLYDLSDAAVGKRPVAVTVNNIYDAMPQYGVSSADIIIEFPVESGLSRLLCIYPDYTAVPYIVSVRSYRYYFASFACGFDAFYVHWGQDETMMSYYYSLGMDTFNGMTNSYLFGRDQGRLSAGYALEHTSYFNGTLFGDYVDSYGYRTDLAEGFEGTVFDFTEYDEDPVVPESDEITYAQVSFGSQYTTFDYNAEDSLYYKTNGGAAQIDGITGEQLAFTNLLVLETSVWTRDDIGHKGIDWNGSGGSELVGYYFTQGRVQNIYWSKDSEYARLKVYDENWEELTLNAGKTYIAICPYGYEYYE